MKLMKFEIKPIEDTLKFQYDIAEGARRASFVYTLDLTNNLIQFDADGYLDVTPYTNFVIENGVLEDIVARCYPEKLSQLLITSIENHLNGITKFEGAPIYQAAYELLDLSVRLIQPLCSSSDLLEMLKTKSYDFVTEIKSALKYCLQLVGEVPDLHNLLRGVETEVLNEIRHHC